MSLLHEAIIAEKYGLRLTVDQIADALGLARNTIYNQIAQGNFRVKTYVDGGKRYADYRDLAAYLDEVSGRVATPA
jgi:transcriptional antiterminator